MIGFCARQVASVSVFFVVKERDEIGLKLRPVWDCRAINQYFRRPPSIDLGGPEVLSRLELSPDITQGRRLGSHWGDIPDFFHRCGTPQELWPFMTLSGVSPRDLCKELAARGHKVKPGPRYLFAAFRVA